MPVFHEIGFSPATVEFASRLAAPFVARAVTPVDPLSPPDDFKEERTVFFLGGGPNTGKKAIEWMLLDILRGAGFSRQYIAEFGNEATSLSNLRPLLKELLNPFERRLVTFFDGVMDEKNGFISTAVRTAFYRAREAAFNQGAPVIFNHSMDKPRFVKKVAQEAIEHGYRITMITPHVDIGRVEQRLKKRKTITARSFDMRVVARKHKAFAEQFLHYVGMFNTVMVLDNNGMDPRLAALSRRGAFVGGYDPDVMRSLMRNAHLNPVGKNLWEMLPSSTPLLRLPIATQPVGEPFGITSKVVGFFARKAPTFAYG